MNCGYSLTSLLLPSRGSRRAIYSTRARRTVAKSLATCTLPGRTPSFSHPSFTMLFNLGLEQDIPSSPILPGGSPNYPKSNWNSSPSMPTGWSRRLGPQRSPGAIRGQPTAIVFWWSSAVQRTVSLVRRGLHLGDAIQYESRRPTTQQNTALSSN